MTYGDFRGYSEISNFNPQTRYFHKKYIVNFSESGFFGGVISKIEFEEHSRYGYGHFPENPPRKGPKVGIKRFLRRFLLQTALK